MSKNQLKLIRKQEFLRSLNMQNSTKKIITHSMLAFILISMVGCGLKKSDFNKIAAVVVVAIAAKVIYDMVIEHQSKQVNDESDVVNKYKKSHKGLPDEAVLVSYKSNIMPGGVVKAGDDVSIVSSLEVVRSAATRDVKIEEMITIYDSDDNEKELKSLTKVINEKTNASGAFENEFTFKLPKGMPQGIYPVKTTVLLDGRPLTPVNAEMQLVQNIEASGEYLLAK
jgi:hypothetical protein